MTRNCLSEGVTVGLVSLVLLLTGCQSSPASRSADSNNIRFMSLWETYTDCKVASDLHQASVRMEKLAAATRLQDANAGFVLPLPTTLERFVTSPPSRLAVDVRAMTAACSLHTGQLALNEGRIDMARDVFASVLKLEQEISPYYVTQAQKFLTELEQGLDLARK